MASEIVRNIRNVKNIDILSDNITEENDLISTIDGDVYVKTNKGYRSITDSEKGDEGIIKFENLTESQKEHSFLKEIIHSAKIYDRVLTEQEVQHNYQLEKERWGL